MDQQTSSATPTDALTQAQEDSQPTEPGFGSRGRARRRMRFLRKARELAYRDLGGLVFNLHRFGQRNDTLVIAKLSTLGRIDAELRALENTLAERRPVTILREAGITACPRCAAIHSSEDRYCPNCGLAMDRHADLPIAGGGSAVAPAAPAPAAPAPSVAAPNPPTMPSPQAPPSSAPTSPPSTPAPAPSQGPSAPPSTEEPTEIIHPSSSSSP